MDTQEVHNGVNATFQSPCRYNTGIPPPFRGGKVLEHASLAAKPLSAGSIHAVHKHSSLVKSRIRVTRVSKLFLDGLLGAFGELIVDKKVETVYCPVIFL